MKRTLITAGTLTLFTLAYAGNVSAAVISSLTLSGAASVAAGQSLTITEKFLSGAGVTTIQEIDSVIKFDPAVFSVSNFTNVSGFSGWNTSVNATGGSGLWDFGVNGPFQSTSIGVQYPIFTFTLTALANAASGNSNILIVPGSGFITQVLNGEQVISLSPAPSNSFVSGVDLTVNVTGSGTPEPSTFLLGGLALAGMAIFARRRNRIA